MTNKTYEVCGRFTRSTVMYKDRKSITSWRKDIQKNGSIRFVPMRTCKFRGCNVGIVWRSPHDLQANVFCRLHAERLRRQPWSAQYEKLIARCADRGWNNLLSYPQLLRTMRIPVCYYCGVDVPTQQDYRRSNTPLFIDRKDDRDGYSQGNLVRSCYYCNFTKQKAIHEVEMRIIAALRDGNLVKAVSLIHKEKHVIRKHLKAITHEENNLWGTKKRKC